MSRDIWLDVLRKRVFERAREIRIDPKLSPEVEQGLRELRQMVKEA